MQVLTKNILKEIKLEKIVICKYTLEKFMKERKEEHESPKDPRHFKSSRV